MQPVSGTKYDPTYKKETNTFVAGVVLMLFSMLWYYFVPFEKKVLSVANMSLAAKIVLVLMDLLLRSLVTGWVKTIAIRQNRDKSIWGLFAFFFPSIVLMSIGLTRKIDRSGEIDSPETRKEKKRLRAMMIGLFILVMIILVTLIICFWEILSFPSI